MVAWVCSGWPHYFFCASCHTEKVAENFGFTTIGDNKLYGATKSIDFTLVIQDNGLISCAAYSGTGPVEFFAANDVDEAIEFILSEHNKQCGVNHKEKVAENLNPPVRWCTIKV